MANEQLDLIRKYCDTAGTHLTSSEKDLLCKVLSNPSFYNGFTSELKQRQEEGRDAWHGRWFAFEEWQYRIIIEDKLSIDERYRRDCDDATPVNDAHWEWNSAIHFTNVRDILRILREIEYEL